MDNIKNINMAIKGLTDVEIKKRIDEGLVNKADISTGKTIKEIIVSNIFTYFNLIFLIITMLLIMFTWQLMIHLEDRDMIQTCLNLYHVIIHRTKLFWI